MDGIPSRPLHSLSRRHPPSDMLHFPLANYIAQTTCRRYMIIRQGKSNLDLDSMPCKGHKLGIHKLGFTSTRMFCGSCDLSIPTATLICENCGAKNRFFRADLVPNKLGTVDIFECIQCNELSPINTEVQ
jgi:hypothetical protein